MRCFKFSNKGGSVFQNCFLFGLITVNFVFFISAIEIDFSKYTITPVKNSYIWIEAENADKIEPSFEIEKSAECSGGKYLSLPEDCGSAWAKTTINDKEIPCGIGLAEYKIEIPADGDYAFWGRVKWESGCSDSFGVFIDDQKPEQREDVFIANNNLLAESFDKEMTFDTWHWASCQIFRLSKGEHRLALKNQDDGSHIDKMLLTNDLSFKPQGLAEWTYESSFDSGLLGGWYLDYDNWKIEKDSNGNSLLKKTSEKPSLAFLQNLNTANLYLSANIANANSFRVWLKYEDENNYLRLVCEKKQIFLEENKNSQIKTIATENITGWGPSLLFELFKEGDRLTVVFNSKTVFKSNAGNLKDISRIGIDVNQGGGLDNIFLSPMEEKIHVGENLYLAWLINFNVLRGKWKGSENSLSPIDDGSGLLITGENWWRNYQMAFLVDIPESGSAGPVFYYKDDKNYYCLSLSKSVIALSRVKNGKPEILASFARKIHEPPPPASKSKSAKTSSKKTKVVKAASPENTNRQRVTINRVKSDIQVFLDGYKLFQVSDSAFYSGKAGFFTEKAVGFSLDDIEITSIEAIYPKDKNESISWFENHECRIINSQMDSYGSVGGFHPGDYHQVRKEEALSNVMKRLTGKDCGDKVQVLDFQWLSFDGEAFQEHQGMGQEAGFIIGQSFKEGERKYLWSVQNLFGDWNFSFKIIGKARTVGVLFEENPGSLASESQYVFTYDSSTGKLKEAKNLKIEAGKYDWKAEEWQKISIERQGKNMLFKIGESVLGSYENIPDNIVFRPAIFYENGTVFLDNLTAYVKPVISYNFYFNQPWELALSDWEYSGKLSNGGGYYSYIILGDEKTPGWMRSKRLFSGDAAVMAVVELEKTDRLEIGFEDERGQKKSFEATKDKMNFKSGNAVKKSEALRSFSGEQRRLDTVFITVNQGMASVYLSDESGNQRYVASQSSFWPGNTPFRLKISGAPTLSIQKIMIWGTERQ